MVRNIVEKKRCNNGKYCQGIERRVENEHKQFNTTPSTVVYKCIIVKKIMSHLDNLKRAVLVRLREMRQEALSLVSTNSTEHHTGDVKRKRRAAGRRTISPAQLDLLERLKDTVLQVQDTQ